MSYDYKKRKKLFLLLLQKALYKQLKVQGHLELKILKLLTIYMTICNKHGTTLLVASNATTLAIKAKDIMIKILDIYHIKMAKIRHVSP